jgi:hypothetical protein
MPKKKKSPIGAIVGAAVGGTIFLLAFLFGLLWCLRRAHERKALAANNGAGGGSHIQQPPGELSGSSVMQQQHNVFLPKHENQDPYANATYPHAMDRSPSYGTNQTPTMSSHPNSPNHIYQPTPNGTYPGNNTYFPPPGSHSPHNYLPMHGTSNSQNGSGAYYPAPHLQPSNVHHEMPVVRSPAIRNPLGADSEIIEESRRSPHAGSPPPTWEQEQKSANLR